MHAAVSDTRIQLFVLGAILAGTGFALMFERIRAGGPIRLWPLLLVFVGAGTAAVGPAHQRDEALWLLGTGLWLLAETLVPAALRGAAPLALAVAGLAAFRRAHRASVPVENSHVS